MPRSITSHNWFLFKTVWTIYFLVKKSPLNQITNNSNCWIERLTLIAAQLYTMVQCIIGHDSLAFTNFDLLLIFFYMKLNWAKETKCYNFRVTKGEQMTTNQRKRTKDKIKWKAKESREILEKNILRFRPNNDKESHKWKHKITNGVKVSHENWREREKRKVWLTKERRAANSCRKTEINCFASFSPGCIVRVAPKKTNNSKWPSETKRPFFSG